jgi:hypothetical protein
LKKKNPELAAMVEEIFGLACQTTYFASFSLAWHQCYNLEYLLTNSADSFSIHKSYLYAAFVPSRVAM